jgi:hypothetical protein
MILYNEESVITINMGGSSPSVYSLGGNHAYRRVYEVGLL